ncbi:hypothetical protein GCM10009796_02460 [Microbacterium koreense]
MRQHGRVEFGHGAGPLAESFGVDAALDAAVEEHLHPDTDAEYGASSRKAPPDQLVAPAGSQRVHDRRERADARDDESIGIHHQTSISGEPGIGAGGIERLHRGVDIA